MEFIVVLIVLFVIYKIFIKILPALWFVILFFGSLFILLIWVGILESTGLGAALGILGAIGGAWVFAKNKS